jgi:hypothetical protein
VDESGLFPCWHHHVTLVLHVPISAGGFTIGLLVAAVQRHGLTSIDMINQSVIKLSTNITGLGTAFISSA